MKYLKFTIFLPIIVLFTISFCNIQVKAEDVFICTPDCEEDPFDSRQYITDYQIGDCIYTVTWDIRKACDEWCDIGISSFWTNEGCENISIKDILNEISEYLIKWAIDNSAFLNHLGISDCGPENGYCSDYWRVTKAQCWYKSGVNPSGHVFFQNCDDNCFLTYYEVCKDNYGVITITPLQSYGTGRCLGTACEQVCP